ncbi:MAG: response regulator transcription factor [Campylobacterota bacterium]|nr:response regulator transcription factor [Campylobacterota bacterium]
MNILLFSNDDNLLDRWKNSLSDFDLVIMNSEESLYKEVIKERSVVIVDLLSCGGEPVLFLKPLAEAGASVMVLDSNPEFENTKKILDIGVKGYGTLMMDDIHLNEAVKVILDGNVWLYPDFIDEMVFRLRDKSDSNSTDDEILSKLSQREKEVALCIKNGKANKEIAQSLDITIRTVKAHTKNIYDKVGVSNRLALALLFNK